MKKISLTILLATLLGATSLSAHDTALFTEISYGFITSEKSVILGQQKIGELVGKSSKIQQLKVGLQNKNASYYTFISSCPGKNNEVIAGIGGSISTNSDLVSGLSYSLSAQGGGGFQQSSNKVVPVSSSVNKLTYIIDQINSAPTYAKFEENSYLLSVSLGLGVNYKLSEKVSLGLNGQFTRNYPNNSIPN